MPRIRKDGKKVINSRAKGADFERKIANILKEHGWDARRGQQFSGGSGSPDVVHSIPDAHFELKAVENLNLYAAMEQASKDAGPLKSPIVIHKKNKKPILVTMGLEDYLKLVEKAHIGDL